MLVFLPVSQLMMGVLGCGANYLGSDFYDFLGEFCLAPSRTQLLSKASCGDAPSGVVVLPGGSPDAVLSL